MWYGAAWSRAERWVSKNILESSGGDRDYANGLFDTSAGPVVEVFSLSI